MNALALVRQPFASGRFKSMPVPPVVTKVACSPIFNCINPAGLEVVQKQVPEADFGKASNVGAIVNNDVKPIRGLFLGYSRQEFSVLLESLVHENPVTVGDVDRIDIQANNSPLREIVSPHEKQAPFVDTQFKKTDVLLAQRGEDALASSEIVGRFVCVSRKSFGHGNNNIGRLAGSQPEGIAGGVPCVFSACNSDVN